MRPTLVEPVNDTTRTASSVVIGVPTSGPSPVTTLTKLSADSGVCEAGLKTTVLPHTSAGMIFHEGIAIGKFHGVMIEHTPSGWRTDIANLLRSSDGTV